MVYNSSHSYYVDNITLTMEIYIKKLPNDIIEFISSYVITEYPLNIYTLCHWNSEKAFEIACKNDDIRFLSLLKINKANITEYNIAQLSEYGSLKCYDYLTGVIDFTEGDNELLEIATQNEHFDCVKYISGKTTSSCELLSLLDAIDTQNHEIFIYILEHISTKIDLTNTKTYDEIIEPNDLIDYSAKAGYIFLSKILQYVSTSHITNISLLWAIDGDDLECLKTIIPHTELDFDNYIVLCHSACQNSINCLQYLLTLITDNSARKEALIGAAEEESIECLNIMIPLLDMDCHIEALEAAVDKGDCEESIKILAPIVPIEVADSLDLGEYI